MKKPWVCDEEGLICSQCGKDIYHCKCREEKDLEEAREKIRKQAIKSGE